MKASSREGNVCSLRLELHCPYAKAGKLVRIGPTVILEGPLGKYIKLSSVVKLNCVFLPLTKL